ncbi:MAG: hypothetical protein KKD18_01225 [Nanoarchaeota archaeon]|nr:hypothetical protein [Nanoarchaeota archaeon]MBU0977015.1 hypothetical protein [Nanoarchaeota archaeon]
MVTKKKLENTENTVEEKTVSKKVNVSGKNNFDKIRANPWIASTIVLGLILVLVLALGTGGGSTTAKVTADEAGQKVLTFLNSNPAITGEVSLVSAEEEGQFYKVTLTYQGQEVPVYTTKDALFLVGNPVSLTETANDAADSTDTTQEPQPDTSVPKSDKPVVELFVMSYCPYGTQIEKGILPVAELLGDKIDFEIKFVNYAMHGDKEVYENLNQYCIEKEQNDKFLDYMQCFLDKADGPGCITEAGINKAKLDACTKSADEEFAITENFNDQSKWLSGRYPQFNTNQAENEEYGVRGSPTLIVNGKETSSGRDPASLLGTICAAFNNAPEECNTELSSASPSPGFGWTTTAADSAAAAQCG